MKDRIFLNCLRSNQIICGYDDCEISDTRKTARNEKNNKQRCYSSPISIFYVVVQSEAENVKRKLIGKREKLFLVLFWGEVLSLRSLKENFYASLFWKFRNCVDSATRWLRNSQVAISTVSEIQESSLEKLKWFISCAVKFTAKSSISFICTFTFHNVQMNEQHSISGKTLWNFHWQVNFEWRLCVTMNRSTNGLSHTSWVLLLL